MKDIRILRDILATLPKFRQIQAQQAVFGDAIADWQEASVFPLALREKLNQEYPLRIEAELQESEEKTRKALIRLEDGEQIETVLIVHRDKRHTVCLSSQAGCPLGCAFCATGQNGFRRNLSEFEIMVQVLFWKRQLSAQKESVSHLVFMGMGEPFLNYDAVLGAMKLMNQESYFNIGSRHMSVSTSGIVPGIRRFAKEDLQANLAISLHASTDKQRSQLMPINQTYPLAELWPALDEYIDRTHRRLMLEYMMIKGVNDSLKDAATLVALIGSLENRRLCFVNIIPYNPTGRFQASDESVIKTFCAYLEKNNIAYTRRHRFGDQIDAACGQLAGRKKD